MTRRASAGAMIGLLLPLLTVVGPANASPAPSAAPSATSTSPARPATATAVPTVCRTPARRGFVPLRASVGGVGRNITVYSMGRGRGGVPLAPPLTSLGKGAFAWDRYGPKPGAARGNVRFNAHTYPDGSALGNRMLARLKVGNRIILYGQGVALCYQVTRRITTTPRRLAAYYYTTGSPKLAIVVCSGRRLGPGAWTHRTIWYARPVTR